MPPPPPHFFRSLFAGSAFAYILEEREAHRQKAKLDEAVQRLQLEAKITTGRADPPGHAALRARLLDKLLLQQARLAALHPRAVSSSSSSAAAGGRGGALDARTTDSLAAGAVDPRLDLDAAFTSLSTSDIVDVLIGVKEEFGGSGAGAAANEGVAVGGGGGGGGGGSSKGSGATNDLFTSPSFASGRVFSFATMDAVVSEAHFSPSAVGVVKSLVRAGRSGALVLLPVSEALVLLQLAGTGLGGAGGVGPKRIARARAAAAAGAAANAASPLPLPNLPKSY